MENAEEDGDNVSESLVEKDVNKPMQLCFGAFHKRQIPIVKGQMSDSTRKRKIKAMKDLAQELNTRAKVQTILCIVSPNKKIPTRFLESYGDHADKFLFETESGSKIQSILKVATETWIGICDGKQPERKNQKEQSTNTAEDTVTTKAARHVVQIAIEKAEEKRKRLKLIENKCKEKRNRMSPAKSNNLVKKLDTSKTKKDQRKHLPNKRSSFTVQEAVSGTKTTLEILETHETNSKELFQEIQFEPICRKGKKGSYIPLHVNHFQESLEKHLDDSETSETSELNHYDFTGSTNSISISPRSPTTFQTDQEPLSPVFSSVFNAEVADSASAGVLRKVWSKAKHFVKKSDTYKTKKDQRKHSPNKRSSYAVQEAVSGTEKGKKGSYIPLHVNHFQESLEKHLDDSETSETSELNHFDFTGNTNSISISPRSPTTFQTDQEPLSPVFSSVFNTEVVDSASSGVLQKARHLEAEATTTGREIMIGKTPDVVNARNEQKEGHITAQEREPNQEASSILPIPVGCGNRPEAKWHILFSNNEYSPPKNCPVRTTKTRKRFRISGKEEQNKI